MKHSTTLHTAKTKYIFIISAVLITALMCISLFTGKFPLSFEGILNNEHLQRQVFFSLRLSRSLVALFGGFALGVTGFVFQSVFRNPLASPDIIGISSGASAGAAVGILFFSGAVMTTLSAFMGAIIALLLALGLSAIDKSGKNSTIVLSGICVHSVAQTFLMCLKLTADPERELASIEYWIMGSLNAVSIHSMWGNAILCILCLVMLFLLHRQAVLLSAREDESYMLGVSVAKVRLLVLFVATLTVSSVISLTGLISFIGLIAPHSARLVTKSNNKSTMLLSGLFGTILLIASDILAKSIAQTELPVSIFTSLLGAPFLIYLIVSERRKS